MNKKQVGALLKIISKDDLRPALATAAVQLYQGYPYIIATNGYALAAIKLDESATGLLGKIIRRDAIERWYKLANGKSRLDSTELEDISKDDFAKHGSYLDVKFPEWTKLVPDMFRRPTGSIKINATYMQTLQELDGSDNLIWNIGGELEPLVSTTERGIYIFMPMKS